MLDILYEQGPCLALNKPAGLSTQAPAGIESLEVEVKDLLRARRERTGNVYLGMPHRLDRPVSGAVVVALHSRAARRLSKQFEARTVRKVYWAIVAGRLPEPSGVWTDWMRKVPDEARAEIVPPECEDARQAILRYDVIGETPLGSWLAIRLETGRMHQIRLQAASRGFPIIGDALYGSTIPFGPPEPDWRRRPIALHARELAFLHPMTREPVSIIAPLPESWRELTPQAM